MAQPNPPGFNTARTTSSSEMADAHARRAPWLNKNLVVI
jgi:hypothetical protein